MAAQLKPGSLDNADSSEPQQPHVLQVLQVKQLANTANAIERYKLIVSDSTKLVQCMLATQLNVLVSDTGLARGKFINLKAWTCNKMGTSGKRVMVCIECDVLPDAPVDKIGQPVPVHIEEPSAAAPIPAKAEPGVSSTTNFYGNKETPVPTKPAQQQQQQMKPSGSQSNVAIYPIEALSPYQNKWTIKARVVAKSEIKHWHNPKGEGKLFSCTFLDESGEIRATGFNDAVDKYYEYLVEGHVYTVTKCRVSIAKKQFSNVNNEYELTFERDTEIESCPDAADVPQVKFSFLPLAKLDSIDKDGMIDCIGVVKDIGDVSEITSKMTHKPYSKRDLVLVDESGYEVKLTIWGKLATEFKANPESILAVKGVKVSDFGGRTLSTVHSSTMLHDPEIPEAFSLRGWYDQQGKQQVNFSTHASAASMGAGNGRVDKRYTIEQAERQNMGMNETVPDYYELKGTIIYIKTDNISYPACASEACNKKVVEDNEGGWRCEKCDKNFPEPQHRYMLTLNVQDHTGQQWLSGFDNVGQLILGCSAGELQALKNVGGNDAAFKDRVQEAHGSSWIFKLKAKQDSYNGQVKVRTQILQASPLDYGKECKLLEEQIAAFGV
ncbi:replication factor-A protein [Protomyces lactucae-debilis]|uniref:Replication protein A subunit n=1 Tax=Protomyces lactucae-debilis TaxID=2754530 RepID=A0A1Y2FK30_PROLT|nr:replication factor-A protein [Protomyces lactucae-debilis]ORY84332.1 replication factor-A protein [Protomyces lactucae-debilis]